MRKIWLTMLALASLLVIGCLYLGYPLGKVIEAPETDAAQPGGAVILLSGDGGTRTGMSRAVADQLREAGIPVVLVNSLTFFSRHRNAQEISDLLRRAITVAASRYHATRVVMIGQSFGADVLPTGLAGLSPSDRKKIAGAILIVPSHTMLLRATPFELFNWGDEGIDTLPAAQRLTWVKLACIGGAEERESLCPSLSQPGLIRKQLPGAHYLRHDDGALFKAILPIVTTDLAESPAADHAAASRVETASGDIPL